MAGLAPWHNVNTEEALKKGERENDRWKGTGKIKNETLYWTAKSRYKPDGFPEAEQPSRVTSTNQVDVFMLLAISLIWQKKEWQAIEHDADILPKAMSLLNIPTEHLVWKSYKELYSRDSELAAHFILEVICVQFRGTTARFIHIAEQRAVKVAVQGQRKHDIQINMSRRGKPRGKAAPKSKEAASEEPKLSLSPVSEASHPASSNHDLAPGLPSPTRSNSLPSHSNTGSDEPTPAIAEPPPALLQLPPQPSNYSNIQYPSQQYGPIGFASPADVGLGGPGNNGYQGPPDFFQSSAVGAPDETVASMQPSFARTNDTIPPQLANPMSIYSPHPLANYQNYPQANNFAPGLFQQYKQGLFPPTTVALNLEDDVNPNIIATDGFGGLQAAVSGGGGNQNPNQLGSTSSGYSQCLG